MSKILYLDFEFNHVVEPKVNLVCCATMEMGTGRKTKWWLHKSPSAQRKLYHYLKGFDLVIGYACVAEARSFLSLGLNPLKFKWLDLFFEYRMMTNHNDKLQWGWQLVNGTKKFVKKPKPAWERGEGDEGEGFKATHSLAEATFKLTGAIRDTKHKTEMRDLTISAPEEFSPDERKAIMDYCLEDVVHLPHLWAALKKNFSELDPATDLNDYFHEAIERGRYAAHTALMENLGYPIDVEKTKNFSKQIPNILAECQKDINHLFPDIKPFKWKPKDSKFRWDQKATKAWVKQKHEGQNWLKTEKKDISLSLEAFEKFYQFKHDYPRDNFGAQMVRFLKLKQSLYGFSDSGGKRKNFWDSVGSDGRVRAYLNPYGAQSSRSQPAASGFMFLKPAWMRALVIPPKGYFMASIDYGQQEFFIAALESECDNMIKAYLSGDPYLYTGKLSGAIPKEGTKESHKAMRDLFKATTLAIQFLMTKYGLAVKLTNDTGRVWEEEEAQEQIDMFYGAYLEFKQWQDEFKKDYIDYGGVRLPCGWRMFGDNDNLRSVCNVPIQGCLHGDSRVLTREYGFQKIKDISGSKNITVWDGFKFQRADCVPAGLKRLVEITLSTGQVVKCSPEHKFLCVNNRGVESWKTPGDFGKQTFIRRSEAASNFSAEIKIPDIPNGSAHNYKDVSLKYFKGTKLELGVLLGRMASDGEVSTSTGCFWLVAEHEKTIIPYLKNLIGKMDRSFKCSTLERPHIGRKPIYHFHIYSKKLVEELRAIGLKRSLEHSFVWSDRELLRGFLRGYFDGDGGVCGTKDRGSVVVAFGKGKAKLQYAYELQKALSLFGVQASVASYSYRTNLRIRKKSLRAFVENIGFINPAKNKKVSKLYPLKRVSNVLKDVAVVKAVRFTGRKVEMYDIANCPNSQFSTDGLITHNTGASVMRKAVDISVTNHNIDILFTLHDALYMQGKIGEEYKIKKMADAMRDAFVFYADDKHKDLAAQIKLDPYAWSPDYKKDSTLNIDGWEVPSSNLYVDTRSIFDYQRFSKFFTPPDYDLL